MEKDNELLGTANSIDFGARIYDPRLGRWMSIDPLAKKFVSWSPYSFVMNNPLNIVDIEGKDTLVIHMKSVESIDKNTVVFKLTFSLIQSKMLQAVEAPMNSSGNNEIYVMTRKQNWIGKNTLKDHPVYDIAFKPMARHPEWENTIFLQPVGRGQFFHPGKRADWGSGCMCPGENPTASEVVVYPGYTDPNNPELSTPESSTVYTSKSKTIDLSQEMLNNIKSMYDQYSTNNSTSGVFGFLLAPYSETRDNKNIEPLSKKNKGLVAEDKKIEQKK